MSTFKETTSFEKRIAISNRILELGERVPIIIEPGKNAAPLLKNKYNVSRSMSFGKLMAEVRKNVPRLNPSDAVFYFLPNNTMPAISMKVGNIYDQFKDPDGFLYLSYTCENTFGHR